MTGMFSNGPGEQTEFSMQDFKTSWQSAVESQERGPEARRILDEIFQRATERAQAIVDGRLDPLSA
jgi:hypothetical protein